MSAVWEVSPRGETDDEHQARMEAKSARRGELYASYRAAQASQRRKKVVRCDDTPDGDEAEVRGGMRPGDTLQRLWWTEPNEEWRDA